MTILVTGARGNVGRHVVDQLLAAGVDVRGTSRNPESAGLPEQVQVVRADLSQPETLPTALAGVAKVFLYAEPEGIDGFVAAAQAAWVEHVVLLSSAVTAEEPNVIQQRHRVVEQALAESGLAWTFVRPGSFATNTLRWAPSIRAEGVVRHPYPNATITPIHERDIASVAMQALTGTGHEGASYTLSGPEPVTQQRQAELIGEAISRPVRFEELTPEQARDQLSRFMPPGVLDTLLGHWCVTESKPEAVVNTVEEVTGQPARTFAQWAADHAADFR